MPFAVPKARKPFVALCKRPKKLAVPAGTSLAILGLVMNGTEQERINMNKIFATAFLALGAALSLTGYFTYLASLSAGSDSPSLFVTPTDTTVWLVIFGLMSA